MAIRMPIIPMLAWLLLAAAVIVSLLAGSVIFRRYAPRAAEFL